MYLVSAGHTHLAPGTSMVQRLPRMGPLVSGGCGGSCGAGLGCGCSRSLAGLNGLGLFDSGFDLSGWGPMEWAVAALGGFALYSMFSTGRRGISGARRSIRARKSRGKRRRQLEEQLKSF